MSAQREIYKGRVIRLTVDAVTLPNGVHTELEVVHHPGGTAIVALDGENRVCLLRQYRHAAGGWVWELPAGKLEAGELVLATAQRELVEEAGVKARDWKSLGRILTSPGVFNEVIHLFLARDLEPVAAAPEADELFEIHWLPWHEVLARAARGEIEDAKTLCGLWRADVALTT